MPEIVDKNASVIKIIIPCSVHSILYVKYVFSAKIWFMKTLSRILKFGS